MRRPIELMKQGFCPSSKKLGEYASVGIENIKYSTERKAFKIHLGYCSACQEGYNHLHKVFQQTRESFPRHPEGTITDADRWREFLKVLNAPYQFCYIPELPQDRPNDEDEAFINRLEKRFQGIEDPIDKLFINIGLYNSVYSDGWAVSNFEREFETYYNKRAEIPETSDIMHRDLRLRYLIGKTYLGTGNEGEAMDWLRRADKLIHNHLVTSIEYQKKQFKRILEMYPQIWLSYIRTLSSSIWENIADNVRALISKIKLVDVGAESIETVRKPIFDDIKDLIIGPSCPHASILDVPVQLSPMLNPPLGKTKIRAVTQIPDDLWEAVTQFLNEIDEAQMQKS